MNFIYALSLVVILVLSFQLVVEGKGGDKGKKNKGGSKSQGGQKGSRGSVDPKIKKPIKPKRIQPAPSPSLIKPKPPLIGTAIFLRDAAAWKSEYSKYLTKFKKPKDRVGLEKRLESFRKNVEEVYHHNNKYNVGEKSWYKGINRFTDMTDKELKRYMGYKPQTGGRRRRSSNSNRFRRSTKDLPESLDYGVQGAISPIKDQGECGCCFAFAVVGCMESKHAIQYKEIIDLSEQYIVDCSKTAGNNGCDGGNFKSTFKLLKEKGVDVETRYEYKAFGNQSCKASQMLYKNRIDAWSPLDQDEDEMREAIVTHGPIVASLTVDKDFFSYAGGTFTSHNKSTSNHAVIIVGYGKVNGTEVWYIKNSWGKDWGQEGFMSIQRNANLRQISDGAYTILIYNAASQSANKVWLGAFAFIPLVNMFIACAYLI